MQRNRLAHRRHRFTDFLCGFGGGHGEGVVVEVGDEVESSAKGFDVL